MDNKLIDLLNETESLIESIGGKDSLDVELTYYDSETLRPQFPSIEHLAVRLFDSWWNTTKKQLLIRDRFPNLERALHIQGVQALASKPKANFDDWLVNAFGISARELEEKLTWKQFIDQGGAWACLNFIAQFSEPEQYYERISGEIGVGSWKLAKEDWKKYVKFAWVLAHRIAYKMSIPNTNSVGILGIGTVLMCDFLKETGVELYGKPDTQVKKVFKRLGLIGKGGRDEDYETFELLWHIAALTEHTPAVVDKVLWMASSGRWDKTLDRGLYSTPPILSIREARENRKERVKYFNELLENLIKRDC